MSKITLFDHQVNAITEAYRLWELGNQNVLVVLPTGAGKTLVKAEIARRILLSNEVCMVFAHRDVLLEQISDAMCLMGVRHSFIAAAKTIRTVTNQNLLNHGDSYYDETSPIIVASVPTTTQRIAKGQLNHIIPMVKWWLMDECFPSGTLIDGTPIEHLKVGDYVTAFNDVNGEFSKRKVVRLFKNPIPELMTKVVTKQHHVTIATNGHPFWTKRGWVNACDLTINDEVLVNDQALCELSKTNYKPYKITDEYVVQSKENILFSAMCCDLFRETQTKQKTRCSTFSTMYSLWDFGRPKRSQIWSLEENKKSVLWGSLQQEASSKSVIINHVKNKSNILLGTNEEKQSHEEHQNTFESIKHIKTNRTQTKCERWEWETSNQSRVNSTFSIFPTWVYVTDNSENRFNWETYEYPNTLQNRLRKCNIENSNRSRWYESQLTYSTRTGQEKNNVFKYVRLESVSVQKSRDIGKSNDGFVYNIEVDELHTYIANGVVVHNCHHTLEENQWGRCIEQFHKARGLGVTATPIRGDGKGLGRGKIIGYADTEEIYATDGTGSIIGYTEPKPIKDNDGVFDAMFVGATMGELMTSGRLSAYKIYTKDVVDVQGVKITTGGDYNQNELAKRTNKSEITGDAVQHYLELAAGKQGITFCVNIAHSEAVADEFNNAGIVSVALSSKTPDAERQKAIQDFKAGQITMLVNADLFGEGFDCPAVEVVIQLRKTQSYSLFKQQFGRALRVFDGKPYGILIDHVGNVPRHCTHGAPHDDPEWSLGRRKKRNKNDDGEALPVGRICTNCGFWSVPTSDPHICPDCKHKETEPERLKAQQDFQAKEGRLIEMDIDFINALIKEREKVDKCPQQVRKSMHHAPAVVVNSAVNNHTKRQFAQNELRQWVQAWCRDVSVYNRWDLKTTQNEFEIEFGVNILKAQVLSERLTLELLGKLKNEYA